MYIHMRVNKRYFKYAPPSFPKQYDKEKVGNEWVYQSIFISHKEPHHLYLRGVNPIFDYMGNVIPEVLETVEAMLAEKPKIRQEVQRRYHRLNHLNLRKPLQQKSTTLGF